MCGDPEDAREVTQDTLLAAARGLDRFREASSPSTWLYTIARRFCIRKRRRGRFAPKVVVSLDTDGPHLPADVPDPGRDPEQELDNRRLAAALDDVIADLEPGYREVLVLRDVEGLTAAEVAEVTGLGTSAVKSRLHRARVRVRERLSPLLGRVQAPSPACRSVAHAFSRRLEDDIDPATCAEMEQHLAGCAHCTAACESLKRVLSFCRTSAVPEVPSDLEDSVRAGIRAFVASAEPEAAASPRPPGAKDHTT